MTQFTALLIDGYRQVNDRKLFWITLGLSGLVVLIIGMLGVTPDGAKVLFWELPNPMFNSTVMPPDAFYKFVFTSLGISLWLAWIASILALISTGSIFPDFLAQGSVDLVLSRPISRVKIFFIKYLSGLVFAALQVTVFTVGSFLVIGLRGGVWEPGLFIAIPVFVLFYSYLFSVCVFLGVLSRSSMLAILLTILLWFCLFIVNFSEALVLQNWARSQIKLERLEERLAKAETESQEDTAALLERVDEARDKARGVQRFVDAFYLTKTVMPKTGETIALLERWLIHAAHLPRQQIDDDSSQWEIDHQAMQDKLQTLYRERSVGWIIGTSLIFEGVLLTLACWRFARRDF